MRNRFQTFHTVFNILGSLFIVLGAFLFLPLIIIFFTGELRHGSNTFVAFLLSSIIACLLGIGCRFLFRQGTPNRLQAALVCGLGWLGFSAIGALPFVWGINASYLNGFFEAISGFTTTGITMFTGLDQMPKSILFWRSLTQWIGGLGILTFFLAVTYRGGSAHMLFGAESHKTAMVERPVPGLANTLKILWAIYTGFTVLILVGLSLAGMSFFDSLCHSFTALSTGGFSPHDASIGYYRLTHPHFVWIEYILILGMLMGGTNFLIHYRLLNGSWKALYDSTEMKYWWTFIIIFVIIIFAERSMKLDAFSAVSLSGSSLWSLIEKNFRTILFQVVAIITTTGFGTQDIGSPFFGQLAKQFFLVMMVIGGCVGSTGGGLKVLRVSILVKVIRREIFRLRTPTRSISTIIVDDKPIAVNEVYRVGGLFFAWVVLLIFGGGMTALFSRLSAYQSFSGMFSALGNIGPCYIPVTLMGQLNPVIKIIYIFGMLAGRLEILPVLLLFSRRAWKV